MPRNGSGVYSPPAGSTITNGDTSDASDLNVPLADLATDANTPRPVVAGGTGASTVAAARTAFGLGALAVKDTIATAFIDDDAVTTAKIADGAVTAVKFADGAISPPRGYLYGLQIANGSDAEHDIDVIAGECASDSTSPVKITLSALSKRLDAAFVEGTGSGAFATGETLPTSGTVNVWVIGKSDGTSDVFANDQAASGFSPTLPAGFTEKRRIASLRTDGSENILPFVQTGDYFQLVDPVLDVNVTNPGASAVLRSLTVPTGLKLRAMFDLSVKGTSGVSNGRTWVSDPDTADVSAATGFAYGYGAPTDNALQINIQVECFTDTSAQIRTRAAFSSSSTSIGILTRGWIDSRGQS